LGRLWGEIIVGVRYFYNGDKRCTIAVEPTSARRRELYGLTEASRSERILWISFWDIEPARSNCVVSSTSSGWIGPGVVARGFTRKAAVLVA
jgi:hypothetical protein